MQQDHRRRRRRGRVPRRRCRGRRCGWSGSACDSQDSGLPAALTVRRRALNFGPVRRGRHARDVAKISDYLTPEQIRQLRGKSDFVGALLVLHAWALIAGSMALFAWWPNPAHFPARRDGDRRAPARPRHIDARCRPRPAVRQPAAERQCREAGSAPGPSSPAWRFTGPITWQHHRFTQQAEDPDLSLSAAFPISRRSLHRKILRDLTGQTAYLRRGEQISRALGLPISLGRGWAISGARRRRPIVANLLFGVLAVLGYWWLYPLLWLLPLATWYQLVSRIRNIAEHAVVPDNDDPCATPARPTPIRGPAPLGALLGQLPPRTPSVYVRAVLAPAAASLLCSPPTADGRWS